MMTLEQARKSLGRNVTYARYDDRQRPDIPTAGPEYGIITGVSATSVFVRYGAERGSKATAPADLTLDPG